MLTSAQILPLYLLLVPTAPITVTNPAQDDSLFGAALCWAGDAFVVGSPNNVDPDNNGAVYIFEEVVPGLAFELVKPIPGEPLEPVEFPAKMGASLACADGLVVTGAPGEYIAGEANSGAVYAFVFDANSQQWATHPTPRLALANYSISDRFGSALALDAGALLVGAPGHEGAKPNTGLVVRYELSPGAITELAVDQAAVDTDAGLGSVMALSGDVAVVIAAGGTGPRAFIYTLDDQGLTQTQVLALADLAVDACGGVEPDGVEAIGQSAALHGETLLLGAPLTTGGAQNSGVVFVFERSGGTWACTRRLESSAPSPSEYFGGVVALASELAVVSATGNSEQAPSAGAVYVFTRGDEDAWSDPPQSVRGEQQGEELGCALALQGDRLAVSSCGAARASIFTLRSSLGEACTSDEDCAEGSCADGVCCDHTRCLDDDCWRCDTKTSPGSCQYAAGQPCSIGEDCRSDICMGAAEDTGSDSPTSDADPSTSSSTTTADSNDSTGAPASDGGGDNDGDSDTGRGTGGAGFNPDPLLSGCLCRPTPSRRWDGLALGLLLLGLRRRRT